jgi:hypothetical protein
MSHRLCGGWSLPWIEASSQQVIWRVIFTPIEASSQEGYMAGDPYPGSRLRAKKVIWRVILIPDRGFEPSRLYDRWSLSLIMASSQQVCTMGDHHPQSWLRAKQDMWRVIIIPDHGFMPTGCMCRPWWHTRLQAI